MNSEYIKDYKNKELKQYVLAYLLLSVASVGFFTSTNVETNNILSPIFKMVTIDLLVGAICTLVFVFNELWSDKAKTRIIYNEMPSNTVFSDIASGKIDATEFDINIAKKMYAHLNRTGSNQQSSEWNKLLKKSRDAQQGNVIEAERMQLMTRDICMSTISLIIMTIIAFFILVIVYMNMWDSLKYLGIPLAYLIVMFFITRFAARNRAARFVTLVIKNDVQSNMKSSTLD